MWILTPLPVKFILAGCPTVEIKKTIKVFQTILVKKHRSIFYDKMLFFAIMDNFCFYSFIQKAKICLNLK